MTREAIKSLFGALVFCVLAWGLIVIVFTY